MFAYFGVGQPVWTERQFEQLAKEGYQRNPIVYACLRRISRGVASIPVNLYDQDAEIERHPLLDLIRRPNPEMTQADFIEAVVVPYVLGGNAYVERVGITQVRELYPLRADRMKVITGTRGWPSAFEYEVAGQRRQFPVRSGPLDCDVLQLKQFNPLDDYYGQGSIEAAAYAVDIHNETSQWAKGLVQNAARPSGAFVHTPQDKEGAQSLGEAQFRRLKEELAASVQGGNNAGKPLLLEGGLNWTAMGLTPMEMDFINTRREVAREIALSFGVPPMVLGIPGDNTYANYREANAAFFRETVIPLATLVYARLSQWLAPRMGSETMELRPDLDEIPALAEERREVWNKVSSGSDILTVDERREALGYAPTGNADGKVILGVTQRPMPGAEGDTDPPDDPDR
ncbi:phage portal protein [Paracoccus versutus]|nr:phage portal protein [Paracoccus versutus]